eukprot:6098217-Amphidinium_carterae.1
MAAIDVCSSHMRSRVREKRSRSKPREICKVASMTSIPTMCAMIGTPATRKDEDKDESLCNNVSEHAEAWFVIISLITTLQGRIEVDGTFCKWKAATLRLEDLAHHPLFLCKSRSK